MTRSQCRIALGFVVVVVSIMGSFSGMSLTAQERERRGERGVRRVEPDEGRARSEAEGGPTKRWAVLVGVDAYQSWPRLGTPVNDVVEIGKVLAEVYGYSVKTVLDADATRLGIVAALRELEAEAGNVGPGDEVIVYFAGHGETDKTEGFWIPVEGSRGEAATWLTNRRVKEILGECAARHILLVSDSCYSGTLTRSGPTRRTDPDLASREIIASGQHNEPVADAGYRGHSVFAFHLLALLRGHRRDVEAGSATPLAAWNLFRELHTACTTDDLFRQVPAYGKFDLEDQQDGTLIFRVAGAESDHHVAPEEVFEGVPDGWRLPRGYRWLGPEEGSGGVRGNVFVKTTGTDVGTRMRLVLPGGFPYRGDVNDNEIVESPYLVDETEVTVARFGPFVRDRRPDGLVTWNEPDFMRPEQPVVGISLVVAKEFAEWAGKEIPDEVHWECAAAWQPYERGGSIPLYRDRPWGGAFVEAAVPRSAFPPDVEVERADGWADESAWGVVGLGSGVREWCLLPVGREGGYSRRDYGALRGASQVPYGFADLRRRGNPWREVVHARDFASRGVGFRCIRRLERLAGQEEER